MELPELPTGPLPGHHLIRGLFYGGAFALIEFTFTSLVKEDEAGHVRFAPHGKGHTTWAMVPGSILGGMYGIEPFYLYVRPFADPWWNLALRLALWPVLIWLIEIVWGWLLFHGCNGTRAWHYKGHGARLNGTVKLSFYPHWVGLGLLVEAIAFFACGGRL